jgi:predicted nuclease of predicted toxin-antitoxin system
VKFVVDAQLPPRLAKHLVSLGHDAMHVASLPGGESQPDPDIAAYADAEDRVVVTKDADFRHSHTVSRTPKKLLVVATGNIRNDELLALFEQRLAEIVTAFTGSVFVELHRDVLVVHGSGGDQGQ